MPIPLLDTTKATVRLRLLRIALSALFLGPVVVVFSAFVTDFWTKHPLASAIGASFVVFLMLGIHYLLKEWRAKRAAERELTTAIQRVATYAEGLFSVGYNAPVELYYDSATSGRYCVRVSCVRPPNGFSVQILNPEEWPPSFNPIIRSEWRHVHDSRVFVLDEIDRDRNVLILVSKDDDSPPIHTSARDMLLHYRMVRFPGGGEQS